MNTQIMQWTQFLTTQGVAYTTERVGTDTLVLFSDGASGVASGAWFDEAGSLTYVGPIDVD